MLESPFPEIILGFYTLAVIVITLYTFGQFHLAYYLITPNKKDRFRPILPEANPKDLPHVTVQLPMYNEQYVAELVIDASAKLDYPSDRLEIQVVDDSNDETVNIVNNRAIYWQEKGIDVKVVRRENREGFKAGALRDATPEANGEFIAIFDADFQPNSDFLLKTIPYFKDDKVGIVQGRWGHLNRNYSSLTKAQTIFLDMFFMVEQQARSIAGFFLRFNGSGGVWRKSCIDDAGGWSADTLSEDLDLAFRAQLKDWKVIYDDTIEVPAEIPVTVSDFKVQQYRWTKGKAQVIKKLSSKIWAKKMPIVHKFHIYFDLFNILAIPSVVILAALSIPLTLILLKTSEYNTFLAYFTIGLINVVIAPWFSWLVVRRYNETKFQTIKELARSFFPLVLLLLGITFTQFVSMFDGFFGSKKIFFHRTSKYNISGDKGSWKDKVYTPREIPLMTYIEGILVIYFAWGLYIDITNLSFGFLPFHTILTLGYGSMFFGSLKKG